MNTNAVHNVMNILFAVLGVILITDLTVFGLDPIVAGKIAAGALLAQNIIKTIMNVSRDGVTGLMKPQPPVEK